MPEFKVGDLIFMDRPADRVRVGSLLRRVTAVRNYQNGESEIECRQVLPNAPDWCLRGPASCCVPATIEEIERRKQRELNHITMLYGEYWRMAILAKESARIMERNEDDLA